MSTFTNGGGQEEIAAVVSKGLEEARQAISRMRAEVTKGLGGGGGGGGGGYAAGAAALDDAPLPLVGRAGGPVGGRYAAIINTSEEDLLAGVAVKPARKGLRDALQFGRGKEEVKTPGGGKNKYASRAALALAAASKMEGGV